jgi:hypothetical protein
VSDAAQQASLLAKHAPKLSSLFFDENDPPGEQIMSHFDHLSRSVPDSDIRLLESPPAWFVQRVTGAIEGPVVGIPWL